MAVLVVSPAMAAAQDSVVRTRLTTVMTAGADTPDGQALLEVALAEARTALVEALDAAHAPDDLEAMRRHASGVMHAVDPTRVTSGPGLGYGVLRAVTAVETEVAAMAAADGKADIARAAPLVLTAAGHIRRAATALLDAAQRVRAATSAETAATLAADLPRLARQLAAGGAGTDPRVVVTSAEGVACWPCRPR